VHAGVAKTLNVYNVSAGKIYQL